MKVVSIKKFLADESGATAIEYGLIAALVSIAMITALSPAGIAIKGMFTDVQTALESKK